MKNVVSKLLALMIAVCASQADMLSAACPMKAKQQEVIAKGADSKVVDSSVMVRFTCVPQAAGGTYQVGILDADGKLHMDPKNKRISVSNPPAGQLFVKVDGPLKAGSFNVVIYLHETNGTVPVNMTTLLTDVSIFRGDRRAFIGSFDTSFTGNTAATMPHEAAFLQFAVFDPKNQG